MKYPSWLTPGGAEGEEGPSSRRQHTSRTTSRDPPTTDDSSVSSMYIDDDEDLLLQQAIEASKREMKREQAARKNSGLTDPTAADDSDDGVTRNTSGDELSTSQNSRNSSSRSTGSSSTSNRNYSISELVASLGDEDGSTDLPPALERRIRDFRFAQQKRRERNGAKKPYGIFGLYAHLSEIRADLEWAEDAAWRRNHNRPYLAWQDFEKARDKGAANRPWFTYGVIFICTIMLLVTFGVNDWKVEPLNVNPLIGPSAETLIKVGARSTPKIVNEGQWYRLFTPIVLHAGLVHFVVNMLATYYIGAAIEQSHGMLNTSILFLVPAIGGNILSAIFLPQYISVGASGGIFGLMGGCVADIAINWNLLFLKTTTDEDTRSRHIMVLLWLGFDFLINTLIGFTPFVDNFTHLGGFLYGLCCGLSTIEKLATSFFGVGKGKDSQIRNLILRFFGLLISVITIMVTTVLLSQSDGSTSPCHGCRYVSCIPFPFREDKWWYCDDCDFVTADLFLATDGSGVYDFIEMTCPNDVLAEIMIVEDGLTTRDQVRRELPHYCRKYCDDVFVSN